MAPDTRASHADRDRVAGELQQHGGAGRLTLAETSERIGLAYQARTLGELEILTLDLPQQPPEQPPASRLRVNPLVVAGTAFAATISAVTLLSSGFSAMCG